MDLKKLEHLKQLLEDLDNVLAFLRKNYPSSIIEERIGYIRISNSKQVASLETDSLNRFLKLLEEDWVLEYLRELLAQKERQIKGFHKTLSDLKEAIDYFKVEKKLRNN